VVEGDVMSATMAAWNANQRPESERPSWLATSYRDIQMQIGRRMSLQYELPQELPDRLLTLLIRVTGQQESD
jgi:hypothetical protein